MDSRGIPSLFPHSRLLGQVLSANGQGCCVEGSFISLSKGKKTLIKADADHVTSKDDLRSLMVAKILRNDWADKLNDQFEMPYYLALREFLIGEYRGTTVYPDMYDIFNALHFTSFASTKVCILGQDPYHGPNQAHGLSFSVKPGVTPPPSLQNIFKELETDLGCPVPDHGCLEQWAREGVLLLNTVLTVRRGQANSHRGKGWECFTDRVVAVLNDRVEPVVFIMWGRNAQAKKSMIDAGRHCIIESAHPSPFSAHQGFFGSRPFSRANRFLQQVGREPVNWEIADVPVPAPAGL